MDPLKLNVLWNPSFENFENGIPSNYIGTTSAHQYANDTYTEHTATGTYAGYLEAQGILQGATVSLKHDIPSSPSAVMIPDISLSLNYNTLSNYVSSNGHAFLEVVTVNSTNHYRYLNYVLSYHSLSLSNNSNYCYYLHNETQNQWNWFDKNLSDDFRDASFLGPLDASRIVVELAFYAISQAGATQKLRLALDDVALSNGTYTDWVENGDFEAGIRQTGWSQFWNNPGAFISQSTESTLGTYSLSLSIPEVLDGSAYGYVQQSFSYPAGYLIESPGSAVVEFDWKYNDAIEAAPWQYCYLRIQLRNTTGAYSLYFYLGSGDDIINSGTNTTAQYHFKLPGFGVRDLWQRAHVDLWDYTQLTGFSNVSIEVMQFYFYDASPGGYLEVLIDDFQLITYPGGDPGFEYDNMPGFTSPHLGWYAGSSSPGAIAKSTDSYSGTYSSNITAVNQEAYVYRDPIHVEIDNTLLTSFWWRLDDVNAGGICIAYIELNFIYSEQEYYIRYLLGNTDTWTPSNSTNSKYTLADGFNQTGIWTIFTRNLTADIESFFLTSADEWILSGIEFYAYSDNMKRISFLIDDVHFTEGIPPHVSSPNDVSLAYIDDSQYVNWTFSDTRPGSYFLLENGTEIDSGSWPEGNFYALEIDPAVLAIGFYNYTLVLVDEAGNTAFDTVIVEIYPISTPTSTTEPTPTTPGPTDGDPLGLILVLAGIGVVAVLIVVFVMLKKKT
jgi:hypothetical protein